MKIYRPFKTVEEVEPYIGKIATWRKESYIIIGARMEGKLLEVMFTRISDRAETSMSSMSTFYNFRINDHPLGGELND